MRDGLGALVGNLAFVASLLIYSNQIIRDGMSIACELECVTYQGPEGTY